MSNEPCRLIQAGRWAATSGQTGGAETLLFEYRLIVKADVALAIDQRVTVNGLTYDVVRVEAELTDKAFNSALLHRRE